MLLSCLPNVFVLVGSSYYLEESPRYLIANNRIDEACIVLENLSKKNSHNYKISH